jgi:hypothetical protein
MASLDLSSNMHPGGDSRRASSGLRRRLGLLSDRGCVLMVGVGLGAAIGYAFASQNTSQPDAAESAPAAVQSAPAHTIPATPARTTAKATPAPAMPVTPFCAPAPTPTLLHTLQTGGPVRIGVFGDSFGDGVWAALYHRFPKTKNFEVMRYSKPSTGFTRMQQLDVAEEAKASLADGPVDIAVINFGANDDQPLIEDGHGVRLLSEKWKQVYADRAERYVALLRAKGATVYWMGLPKMRADAYDRDLASLSTLISERMAKLGVPYIAVRDLSVDGQGAYSDYLTGADGKSHLMRAGDGIHMTMGGYARLAEPLAKQIDADLAHARAVATMPGEPAPAQANCIVLSGQSPALAPAAPTTDLPQ